MPSAAFHTMPNQPQIESVSVESCIDFIKNSNAAVTLNEIVSHFSPTGKASQAYKSQIAAMIGKLPPNSGVYQWPDYSRVPIYSGRPIRAAIEAEFMHAVDNQPLTVTKAAPIVAKSLRRVTAERALKEIKSITPGLVSRKLIHNFAANRQSVVYFSFFWIESVLPPRETPASGGDAILQAIRDLQPGYGNYVRVDHLRAARAVRRLVDEIVIELADSGKLVLARYDGSHQIPDHEKFNYIEDKQGDLFIGVALPRSEDASR